MAINKFMLAALRAISYNESPLNYKADRVFNNITHPSIKFLYKMRDEKIRVDGREIEVRVFEPKQKLSEEILLFFHGGGWVSGNIDSYSSTCASLANNTGRTVMSVDYRLAPEFPFPCAVEDCYRVTQELVEAYGEDNIILIGDSAGGNLAAVVSLMARDRKLCNIKRQILIYPATNNNHTETSPFASIVENGRDYLLTSKKICDYMNLYIQDKRDLDSPYFAPLLAEDLSNQPKTLILTAEFDPLRDEGEAYGEKLRKFGASVTIYRMRNALHGFFSLPIRFSHVIKSYALIDAFLNEVDGSEN